MEQLGQEARSIGNKTLLVTGRRAMRQAGVLDWVMENLRGAGVEVVHFDQVEPNPRLSTVESGAELARREGCEFTIGQRVGSHLSGATDPVPRAGFTHHRHAHYGRYRFGGRRVCRGH